MRAGLIYLSREVRSRSGFLNDNRRPIWPPTGQTRLWPPLTVLPTDGT
jgi:hypothetical protein